MNEAHSGLQRCVRTRQIGRRILPVAHQAGVGHLAMEALNPAFAEQGNQSRVVSDDEKGYLSQPEMRSFIQAALDLGWTLIPYKANRFKGYQFQQHSGINPFVIDQGITVKFDPADDYFETEIVTQFSDELARHCGTAGLLIEESPPSFAGFNFQDLGDNALLFSMQNELE